MKMLFVQMRPFRRIGFWSCCIASILIVMSSDRGCFASADSTTSNSTQSSLHSVTSKPVTTSFAPLPSASAHSANNIQKLAISDLTRDLQIQLKSIEDHELLIPSIQSVFDSAERVPSQQSADHNHSKILNAIASVIEAKINSALRVLNETNHKFQSILMEKQQANKVFLNTILLPCASNAKHSERSTNEPSVEREDASGASANKRKAIEVLNFLKNAGHLHETDDQNFTINKRLTEVLKNIDLSAANVPNFRDVFFLPTYSQISNTNCRNTAPNEHHRYLYASTVKTKKIVLIIDYGATATNSESLEATKSYAQIILNLLTDGDQLTILAATSSIHTMDSPNKMYTVNANTKNQLRKFIESLDRDMSVTNHSLAFEHAFHWIKSEFNGESGDKSTPLQILYVSRGVIQAGDAKHVLEVIAAGQSRLKQPVVINTCAIIIDEKVGALAKEFLYDVAKLNFSKHGLNEASSQWYNRLVSYNQQGKMYIVNHRYANDIFASAAAAVTDIWFRQPFLKTQIIIHQPFYDQSVKDQLIYITKNCEDYGVIGVSIYLSDIAEDLIYHFNQYSNGDETYAFLCDKNGVTIWHPSFPRPNIAAYDPTYSTDIKYFEKVPDNIRKRWVTEESGVVQISKANFWNHKKSKVYHWRRLTDWYIVCLVHILPPTELPQQKDKVLDASVHAYKTPLVLAMSSHATIETYGNISMDSYTEPENKLLFHRLDLTLYAKSNEPSAPKLCQYFKQISILDTSTLYLSPRSFKLPFQHLMTMCDNDNFNDDKPNPNECYHRIENIMAYLKDTTNFLTNPGLQPHVRSDVLTLSHSIELLRMQHQFRSKIEKYVVRRYITSMNGIVMMYPGFSLPNDFDPSRRFWFQKAMENAGKLTITPPYLDIGGAGYIVTISNVIFENGRTADGRKKQKRNVAAIVSIDVTLGFLYQVLLQSSDYCRTDENIRCFIIDDYGYVVVYPNNFDSKMQLSMLDPQFTLNEHITHRESLIANDILQHKTLVMKRMCQNLLNRKVERYYKFNTSAIGAHTNVMNGERTKYQIEAVPNTNLFVIMKNSTEGGVGAAFCPCSTIDKVCFNCKRIELLNCECPCECPINNLSTDSIVTEYMYGDLLEEDQNIVDRKINLFDGIDICARPVEEFIPAMKVSRTTNKLAALNQCVNFTCEMYSNQLDCLGILGCVWCEIDIDQTILLSPFCTQQSSCFGGILGSNTPYGDGDIGVLIDSILPSAYAAIGPIAIGAVVVLFLVIGFAMYCYRNNLEPGSEHLYVESMAVEHNFGLPLTRLDYDTILPHNGLGNDMGDKRNHMGTLSSESPYRSAGYFRNRLPNGESDHGYSTMTPHDDSDHACFTLVEPLINTKCSNQSISDSASFTTEPGLNYGQSSANKFSSASKKHGDHHTELSSPHHIQAPVTVHHPMEANPIKIL